ncbi:MAG: hypothetical protein ACFE0J_02290 [Elainellaceae cyanobacterium]
MNSSENGFSQPSTSASSSANRPDTRPDRLPSSPNALAETDMDQHSHQSTDMLSSASSSTPETASSQTSSKDVTTSQTNNPSPDSSDIPRQQPIPPASEPMQYRAIGLMKGKYIASDEQFTRGQMETEDGYPIDAVLLGRVMSLVKKHLDLEQPHLWVVYPRTRNKDEQLHVQVVGVWEPENLNKDASDDIDALSNEDSSEEDASDGDESQPDEGHPSDAALDQTDTPSEQADAEVPVESASDQSSVPSTHERDADNQASDIQTDQTIVEDSSSEELHTPAIPELKRPPTKPSITPEKPSVLKSSVSMPPKIEDGYFSIRGEVVKQSKEDDEIKVKICQAPRHGTKPAKTFNLTLKGTLDRKAIGYFWDLHVQRQGNDLVVQDGMMIGLVPPSKRSGKSRRSGGGPGRVGGKRGSYKGKPSRPNKRFRSGPRDGQQPSDRPSSGRSSPTARPVKRRQNDSQSTPE